MMGQTDALRVMIDRPELIRQKELLYLKDKGEHTALDMAIAQGHAETADFIHRISPADSPIFKYLIATVLVGGTIFIVEHALVKEVELKYVYFIHYYLSCGFVSLESYEDRTVQGALDIMVR